MKKTLSFAVLYLMIAGVPVLFSAVSCFAGAWTQKSGECYYQFTVNAYFTDKNFDEDAKRDDFPADGDFRDINANWYLEYGLMDRLTVLTSLYYKYVEYEDDFIESKTYGVPDVDLGARYQLSDTEIGIFSFQGLVKIPETYDEDDNVPLGNGQTDLEVRLLYGKSLYPSIPAYTNLEIGYRWRFEEPSDEFRYLVELGIDLPKDFYGRVKLDGIMSMDNADSQSVEGNNPSIVNAFDLGKLDLVCGYRMSSSWAVELGVRPHIYGKNTSAGTNISLGASWKH
jgi:protein XagA